MSRAHIYFVPFPGGGHGIATMHTATTLANDDIVAHFLVLNETTGAKWLKACGQPANPNLHLETLGDGRWQDWQPSSPAEFVFLTRSPEFAEAVDTSIRKTKSASPGDKHTTIIFNTLMAPLVDVGKRHGMKRLTIMPGPYYMYRLPGFQNSDGSSMATDVVSFRGIGGSTEDMPAILGDAVDLIGPMYHQMAVPTTRECHGIIFSTTNEGLDGESFKQEHLPNCNPPTQEWMIGPTLPSLYERALDDEQALRAQLAAAEKSDPVITFLDQHLPRSVVYIAFGSVVQISDEQALLLIRTLRKYNQKWVLLRLHDIEKLEALLGPHEDGVISPWIPQLSALIHPSVKCVVSHIGFGTMIESIYAGLPCICSPISSDEFLNTKVLQHLGISIGNIAINKFESVMTRVNFEPRWPEDDGALIDQVFGRAFGAGGEQVLAEASKASLALRKRLIDTKATKGAESLAALKIFVAS